MPLSSMPNSLETFEDPEVLYDRLLGAVFNEYGTSLYRYLYGSTDKSKIYRCSYGNRQVSSDKGRCDFRVVIEQNQDKLWRVLANRTSHCHSQHAGSGGKSRYVPVNILRLRRVMKRVWEEIDAAAKPRSLTRSSKGSAKSAATSSRKQRPTPRKSPLLRASYSPMPELAVSPQADESDEAKPRIDESCEVLVLSDDEEEGEDVAINSQGSGSASLSAFLGSLSSTFDLSKHVELFRDPKIGVETKEQLMEVAETHLEQLVEIVKDSMGFGPAMALSKGLQKEVEK